MSAMEISALQQVEVNSEMDVNAEVYDVLGMSEDLIDVQYFPSTISEVVTTSTTSNTKTSTSVSTKKPKYNGKLVSGYVVYGSEVRKDRAANNPDSSFGDTSRMVGNEWRNMAAKEKQYWEEKASYLNEESVSKYAKELIINNRRAYGCSNAVKSGKNVIPQGKNK